MSPFISINSNQVMSEGNSKRSIYILYDRKNKMQGLRDILCHFFHNYQFGEFVMFWLYAQPEV